MTAVERTEERFFEAEIDRIAGEVALKSPQPNVAKAEAYFDRALAVTRQQQAKSWELRVAMSMARLWRDQGRRRMRLRAGRSGLRLVHRGVRHARSQGSEGVARRVSVVSTPAGEGDITSSRRHLARRCLILLTACQTRHHPLEPHGRCSLD